MAKINRLHYIFQENVLFQINKLRKQLLKDSPNKNLESLSKSEVKELVNSIPVALRWSKTGDSHRQLHDGSPDDCLGPFLF